ncbi:hypothetical protein BGZ88_012292 [Linnemannia elongata]|nr:hypothetical protein BGZ88_012292 [Linnemannia elongata]KAG0066580.1 hypothetical protein BGZ89_007124 [Linnemannia elongata]KAG0079357.1 hypothetical protein BGZ90_002844 [Linnemannia elongata]
MSDDLENLHRWIAGEPLLGLPRRTLPTVFADINTEMVAQPFYFNASPRGATGAELFRNPENHADAAAAVMTYAGIRSGFRPALGLKGQASQFNDYVWRIATFPGFYLDRSEETVEQRTSQNIDYMINQIQNAYIGFGDADINGVIQSVQRMANSILNKSSTESDKAIFSQDTIQRSSYTTYITLFYATLAMKLDQHGKKTYVEQTYRISRSVIKLNASYLITYADELALFLGDGGLDEWGRQGSSPTGDKFSCFENHFKDAPKEA